MWCLLAVQHLGISSPALPALALPAFLTASVLHRSLGSPHESLGLRCDAERGQTSDLESRGDTAQSSKAVEKSQSTQVGAPPAAGTSEALANEIGG